MHDVEIPLLMFFIALFMIVGGVEGSGFLEYLGTFIIPFVKEDFLLACIILMWVAAIMSAAIDNIPFTAAMIPIIMSLEAQGVNAAHCGVSCTWCWNGWKWNSHWFNSKRLYCDGLRKTC